MSTRSPARTRLFILVSVILLGSCASFVNSRDAGNLMAAAQNAEADSVGITGVVVDRTGDLLAVADDRTESIFCVSASPPPSTDFRPGVRVKAVGRFRDGLLSARILQAIGGAPDEPGTTVDAAAGAEEPGITHVLILMQENHSFDNYFGTYPGVDGLPADLVVEGIAPFHLPSAVSSNMPHSSEAVRGAVHDGRMDRFVSVEGSPEDNGLLRFQRHPQLLGVRGALRAGGPFLQLVPGTDPPESPVRRRRPGTWRGQEPRATAGAGFDFASLPDALDAAGVPWKCYVGQKDPRRFGPLNPLPGFPSLAGERGRRRLVPTRELFSDLRSGSLPAVAWIFPSGEESEHPLTDVRIGMWYVTAVVNALMKSTAWRHTVLVITWDEYGGFYDHVAPPFRHGAMLGPRVRP